MISCQQFLRKEPNEMLEKDCLHHGTPLGGIPSGNSEKNLKLTLDSRSSFSAEVDVETTFLRSPDTVARKEEKMLLLLYLAAAVFHFSCFKYYYPLTEPHNACLDNEMVLRNRVALRHWHNILENKP